MIEPLRNKPICEESYGQKAHVGNCVEAPPDIKQVQEKINEIIEAINTPHHTEKRCVDWCPKCQAPEFRKGK